MVACKFYGLKNTYIYRLYAACIWHLTNPIFTYLLITLYLFLYIYYSNSCIGGKLFTAIHSLIVNEALQFFSSFLNFLIYYLFIIFYTSIYFFLFFKAFLILNIHHKRSSLININIKFALYQLTTRQQHITSAINILENVMVTNCL